MAAAKKDAKLVGGLWLLIGPTGLFIAVFLLYAILNFVLGGGDSIAKTIINILLYLGGIVSIIAWLPGIIIGIVLLATRK